MNSMLRLLAVPLRKYRVAGRDLVTGKYILVVFMNDDTVYETKVSIPDNLRLFYNSNLPT